MPHKELFIGQKEEKEVSGETGSEEGKEQTVTLVILLLIQATGLCLGSPAGWNVVFDRVNSWRHHFWKSFKCMVPLIDQPFRYISILFLKIPHEGLNPVMSSVHVDLCMLQMDTGLCLAGLQNVMLQQVNRKQKGSSSLQTAGCGRISLVSLEESQMPEKTTACLDNREGTVGRSSDYALFINLARQNIGPDFLEEQGLSFTSRKDSDLLLCILCMHASSQALQHKEKVAC
ncbi:uncharacterized protein LOC120407304 [Mauremys reevesii]|uniref:uncharacterized protein LOC120407304 n=1 Tax=Mauremys reevesii TaxID=260615 RepID=UPI00193F36E2|nr:uncharacterized protein LOC120407304 [Mauremys reevesii]